jgi:hypothetical protein
MSTFSLIYVELTFEAFERYDNRYDTTY